ncbi:hypothetical protein ABLI39_00220 [Pseudarthrobacter sp. B907]|uniref:hypothetical protein n=1 Tax=Pseudarthrobacter sp. B907 TaxID=3158261 RepID=UPI0032DA8DF7
MKTSSPTAAALGTFILAGWLLAGSAVPAQAAGVTYYVSAAGNDRTRGAAGR